MEILSNSTVVDAASRGAMSVAGSSAPGSSEISIGFAAAASSAVGILDACGLAVALRMQTHANVNVRAVVRIRAVFGATLKIIGVMESSIRRIVEATTSTHSLKRGFSAFLWPIPQKCIV